MGRQRRAINEHRAGPPFTTTLGLRQGTWAPLPSDPDAQVGWFHGLAAEVNSGRSDMDPTTREWLGRFLETHLPGHPLSGSETGAELIEIVRELRANELAWNRSLQAAIVRADDAFRGGSTLGAREELERFSRDCPWSFFSQVALDQASLYDGQK